MGGDGDPVVSVRDACGGPEVGCNGDATQRARDARVFLRGRGSSTAPRVVYVVVDDPSARGGPFTLRLTRSAPIAPGNCGARVLFDVTAGGTVIGRATTALGSHSGTCGGGFLGEDVLLFNAATRMWIDVLLVTHNQVHLRAPAAVRRTPDQPARVLHQFAANHRRPRPGLDHGRRLARLRRRAVHPPGPAVIRRLAAPCTPQRAGYQRSDDCGGHRGRARHTANSRRAGAAA